MQIIVDADDFHEDNHSLELLHEIREKVPGFCITIFAVPARCPVSFREQMAQIPWIDLVPHGWNHDTARECEVWSVHDARLLLDQIEPFGWTHGFKAPGWNMSPGLYEALLERDYWLADHPKNALRRPAGLRIYDHTWPKRFHYHVDPHHECGNGLLDLWDQIISLRGEFAFIKDVV